MLIVFTPLDGYHVSQSARIACQLLPQLSQDLIQLELIFKNLHVQKGELYIIIRRLLIQQSINRLLNLSNNPILITSKLGCPILAVDPVLGQQNFTFSFFCDNQFTSLTNTRHHQ